MRIIAIIALLVALVSAMHQHEFPLINGGLTTSRISTTSSIGYPIGGIRPLTPTTTTITTIRPLYPTVRPGFPTINPISPIIRPGYPTINPIIRPGYPTINPVIRPGFHTINPLIRPGFTNTGITTTRTTVIRPIGF